MSFALLHRIPGLALPMGVTLHSGDRKVASALLECSHGLCFLDHLKVKLEERFSLESYFL